jgi:hypothetical protein
MPNRLKRSAQEGRVSLAYQTRPHEQSRHEEHQRHEKSVIEADEKGEERRMRMRVYDWECSPQHRGFEQWRSRGWHAPEIRDGGMMGEHEDDKKAAQVADRDVVSADCGMRATG